MYNLFCANYYEENDKIISETFLLTKKTKKLYCVICGKYRKFEKFELSHLLEKTLKNFSVICSNNKKYLNQKNRLRYLKFFVWLKIYNYFKNICQKRISQEFRLKNIDEKRHYFLAEIKQIELISKKKKKVCSNYIGHFLILASTITRCVSISAFATLIGIPIGITSSAIALKIRATTAGIKKCKSIIKKKERKRGMIK